MRKYLKNLLIPFKHIQMQPYQFSVWLFVIIIFGLAGLWFPLITECFENENFYNALHDFVKAGSMASFCIAIRDLASSSRKIVGYSRTKGCLNMSGRMKAGNGRLYGIQYD